MSETRQPILRRLTPSGFLSFGPEGIDLELGTLNILIGPNGSGKSNFIEALALLRATPNSDDSSSRSFTGALRTGGAWDEWTWKGPNGVQAAYVGLKAESGVFDLVHSLNILLISGLQATIAQEVVQRAPLTGTGTESAFTFTSSFGGGTIQRGKQSPVSLPKGRISSTQSVLAQLKDPDQYLEFALLTQGYDRVMIYREWAFGRNSALRSPQRSDSRNDRLEEDFSNLGLFLSRLQRTPKAKMRLIAALQQLYPGIVDFFTVIEGGSVQIFLTEGDITVPAVRLSDGTLRYLCLLSILCDPNPPLVVCIEEPELGLHPDVLPSLAKLLVEASQRTQLIVTTHSEVLVDAMTDHPETIVVCEKHEGRTTMRRLRKDDLTEWLGKYRLGELWSRGHIGGNRW